MPLAVGLAAKSDVANLSSRSHDLRFVPDTFGKRIPGLMLPTFMVIGAAKAGTTALYWYFAEHPQVFMSQVKETNYFAYGLDERGQLVYGNSDIHHFPVKSFAEYEQLFARTGRATAVGEVSPLYLESPLAAGRIRSRLPETTIICCIRHPIDRAYSDYLMYLRNRGRTLDPSRDLSAGSAWLQPDSHWMRIGCYYRQLARYFEAFPRQQLHVFLYEDLKQDPLQVIQQLYRLVGVDPEFTPDLQTPHNVGGIPASRLVESLFKTQLTRTLQPWIPKRVGNWVKSIRTRNMREAPPIPHDLRQKLTNHFRDDICRTSELIGRNLDHWLE
jgi:hypothetical protein